MASKSLKAPIFGPAYTTVDGQEGKDGAYVLKNGYIDTNGCYRKRGGFSKLYPAGDPSDSYYVGGLNFFPIDGKSYFGYGNNSGGDTLSITWTGAAWSSATVGSSFNACTSVWDNNRIYFASYGSSANMAHYAGSTWTTFTSPYAYIKKLAYIDTYILALGNNGTAYYAQPISTPSPYITYGANDYFTAYASPDITQDLITANGDIYLFGSDSVEVYHDTGAPFERAPGGFREIGVVQRVSQHESVSTRIGSDLFLFAWPGALYQITGSSWKRIAWPSQDTFFANQSTQWNGLSLSSFFYDGLSFVTLSFHAWGLLLHNVYCVETESWSQWTFNRVASEIPVFPISACNYNRNNTYPRTLVGFFSLGGYGGLAELGRGGQDLMAAEGYRDILFEVKSGHIDYGTLRKKKSTGVWLKLRKNSGATGTPKAYLTVIDDAIKTWGPYEIDLKGDVNPVVHVPVCGIFNTRQYKITCSDSFIGLVVTDAEERLEVLSA